MSTFLRWMKFNAVGAVGMVVQLSLLAGLNRLFVGRYLLASAVAIELTLLHNFVWHVRFTWRDRQDDSSLWGQLLRFHLSNGLVSLVGNLVLMRLLVQEAHMPVVAANVAAIVCCSVVNFCLGNRWAFASESAARSSPVKRVAQAAVLVLLLFAGYAMPVRGQSPTETKEQGSFSGQTSPLPEAPKPTPAAAYHPSPRASYFANAGAFCGSGATTSSVATKPTAGCGLGMSVLPLPLFFEFGVMGPQANRSDYSGYISVDASVPLLNGRGLYVPFAIAGYSRLFETGHALDYGLALALPRFYQKKDDSRSLRIELRDYWTFANPSQHNVMLRIGWMTEVSD